MNNKRSCVRKSNWKKLGKFRKTDLFLIIIIIKNFVIFLKKENTKIRVENFVKFSEKNYLPMNSMEQLER